MIGSPVSAAVSELCGTPHRTMDTSRVYALAFAAKSVSQTLSLVSGQVFHALHRKSPYLRISLGGDARAKS
jgi:hypothetical protein